MLDPSHHDWTPFQESSWFGFQCVIQIKLTLLGFESLLRSSGGVMQRKAYPETHLSSPYMSYHDSQVEMITQLQLQRFELSSPYCETRQGKERARK